MRARRAKLIVWAVIIGGCGGSAKPAPTTPSKPPPVDNTPEVKPPPHQQPVACGGKPMKVAFYNVGQALAALVSLPDGQHVLVDTGEDPKRPGCGKPCKDDHAHLMERLAADLGGAPIDMLWITHQHSDHLGGAVDIIETLKVAHYVDNGRDLTENQIQKTRGALATAKVPIAVVEPGAELVPIATAEDVKLTAIAPSKWLPACKDNRNQCSIMLRVDYCSSSILFTGDAELEEEDLIDTHGPVTLIQAGHHGSDTSSGPTLLAQAKPSYAVISSGKRDVGMNKTYCHPRASAVKALSTALGGAGKKTVYAFDAAVSCKKGADKNWSEVPASDRIWSTARDGDVVLTTTGDGGFAAEAGQ